MGKRKRRPGHRKSLVSSDIMPCSLGMDSLSEEKSSSTAPSVDSGSSNSLKSIMDTIDSSMKKINTHPSLAQYRYNLSRSMLLRRSLNNYGHHYSRRSTGSHADRISSLCKSASAIDERYSMKLGSRCNSESGYHSERKVFQRPERIRSNPLVIDTTATDVVRMVCGLCMKLLRHKSFGLGSTLSSSGLSVVAVLVCGHVYHAHCLEQRTSEEDKRDPPCPLCIDLSNASRSKN